MSDKIEACECKKAIMPSHAPAVGYVPDWVIEQSESGKRYGCYVECALCGWRSSYHYDDNSGKAHDAAISAWNKVMQAVRMVDELQLRISNLEHCMADTEEAHADQIALLKLKEAQGG